MEDACSKDILKDPMVLQQLVDIVCDGLTFDYLRMIFFLQKPQRLRVARTKLKTKTDYKRVKDYITSTQHSNGQLSHF